MQASDYEVEDHLVEVELLPFEKRDLKKKLGKVYKCSICGKQFYCGAMSIIAMGISRHLPTCSRECLLKGQ